MGEFRRDSFNELGITHLSDNNRVPLSEGVNDLSLFVGDQPIRISEKIRTIRDSGEEIIIEDVIAVVSDNQLECSGTNETGINHNSMVVIDVVFHPSFLLDGDHLSKVLSKAETITTCTSGKIDDCLISNWILTKERDSLVRLVKCGSKFFVARLAVIGGWKSQSITTSAIVGTVGTSQIIFLSSSSSLRRCDVILHKVNK